MFILNGFTGSTCTGRVITSCFAMGLKANKDFKVADCALSDIKTPAWLEHQAFGQMPYLEDTENGVYLSESRAIAKYIAAKVKSPLAPAATDLIAYAQFERACAYEYAQWDGPVGVIIGQLVFGVRRGLTPDMAAVAKSADLLGKKLAAYDAILGKSKFLAGEEITLADYFHLTTGSLLLTTDYGHALTDGSLPNVKRWWKFLTETEAWKEYSARRDEAFKAMQAAATEKR